MTLEPEKYENKLRIVSKALFDYFLSGKTDLDEAAVIVLSALTIQKRKVEEEEEPKIKEK